MELEQEADLASVVSREMYLEMGATQFFILKGREPWIISRR